METTRYARLSYTLKIFVNRKRAETEISLVIGIPRYEHSHSFLGIFLQFQRFKCENVFKILLFFSFLSSFGFRVDKVELKKIILFFLIVGRKSIVIIIKKQGKAF